ncbi:hypothetical protein AB4254_09390 [Vibrio breoganii]
MKQIYTDLLKNNHWHQMLIGISITRALLSFLTLILIAAGNSPQQVIIGLVINNALTYILNETKARYRWLPIATYIAVLGIITSTILLAYDSHTYITLPILLALLGSLKDEAGIPYTLSIKQRAKVLACEPRTLVVCGTTMMAVGLVITQPIIGILADASIKTLYVLSLLYCLFFAIDANKLSSHKHPDHKIDKNPAERKAVSRHTIISLYYNSASFSVSFYCVPVITFQLIKEASLLEYTYSISSSIAALAGIICLLMYAKPQSSEYDHLKLIRISVIRASFVLALFIIFAFKDALQTNPLLLVLVAITYVTSLVIDTIYVTEYASYLNRLGLKHYGVSPVLDSFVKHRTIGFLIGLLLTLGSLTIFDTETYGIAISIIFMASGIAHVVIKKYLIMPKQIQTTVE